MDNQEALNTLSDIRKMMEKSSRFLSLNGTSAIVIGIYSCIAAMLAYFILGRDDLLCPVTFGSCQIPLLQVNTPHRFQILLLFAVILIVICIITTVLMCRYKARRNHQQLQFDRTTKRLLWNFFLPLAVGGILCLSLIWQHHYGLTSSIMLIFYGIALISASNYTYSNARYLGYAELVLGLADSFIEGHALLFWVAGFGIFHIIYGILFYLKYEKRQKVKRDYKPKG